MAIADSFNGYVKIDNNSFAFVCVDQLVTLLPVKERKIDQILISERVSSSMKDKREFIYGEDGNSNIAFLKGSNFRQKILTSDPSLQFSTPLIIKANGNTDGYYKMLTEEWDKFHAIAFCGGNINALFDPQSALQYKDRRMGSSPDGSKEIMFRPKEEYTYTTKLDTVNNIEITVSISRSGQNYDKDSNNAYSLGKLNAYLQFSFEEVEVPSSIAKYYEIARSLIAFLSLQNNVTFELLLRQQDENNEFFDSAICKAYDAYENYSRKDKNRVIPILSVFNQLPVLLEKIINHEFDAVLTLLPVNNKDIHRITISDVQNMCTALEAIYEWKKRNRKKDVLIEQLKSRIKESINEFKNETPEIDPFMETTMSSAFQYLDFTLKNKILTLYQENKELIDEVSKKWAIPCLTDENIGNFVKLRNKKTHSGKFEWGDRADIYPVLFALVYCCSLDYIGVPETTTKSIISRLF